MSSKESEDLAKFAGFCSTAMHAFKDAGFSPQEAFTLTTAVVQKSNISIVNTGADFMFAQTSGACTKH